MFWDLLSLVCLCETSALPRPPPAVAHFQGGNSHPATVCSLLSSGSHRTRFLNCFVPQAVLVCHFVLGRCSFGCPDPVNSMTDETWDVRFLVWSPPDHWDQVKGLGCKGLAWAAGDSRSGSARGWLPSGCGVSISCTPQFT